MHPNVNGMCIVGNGFASTCDLRVCSAGASSYITSMTAQDTQTVGTHPLVQVQGLHKFFGDFEALKGIDLDIAKGEVVALLGASGSGKSTLCRCINRLETFQEGKILIDGEELPQEGKALARLRAEIGMVFQSFNLFPHMTALENITVAPIKVKGVNASEAKDEAVELLRRVGLSGQEDKHPTQMSGGQQQRVAIARSLAMHPKIMLFDEPTSALDPEMIKEVLDVMGELAAGGMTMLVVTHEMGFARQACDRLAFMDAGQIVEQATPTEFFENPRTERARDFLSKILAH